MVLSNIEYLVMGLLQGITEWLPVSSSGQTMLFLINLLEVNPDTAFSLVIYLHLGTLLAVAVRFREDLIQVLRDLIRKREKKITLFLIISTVFTGIVGIPVYVLMKQVLGQSFISGAMASMFIGIFLVLTGGFLHFGRKKYGNLKEKEMKHKHMVLAGGAQGFAIIPGLSRSGITVSALLLMGIEQDLALKLSFLMSIPAVLGALILDFMEAGSPLGAEIIPLVLGVTGSFLAGYSTMDLLIRIARKIRFDYFCVFFGFLTVILSLLIPYII